MVSMTVLGNIFTVNFGTSLRMTAGTHSFERLLNVDMNAQTCCLDLGATSQTRNSARRWQSVAQSPYNVLYYET